MRKLILSALAVALLAPASFAQKAPVKKDPAPKPMVVAPAAKLDRSKKPLPGPAPIINLAKAEQWTLDNGLKVFFVRDTKLPRITYQLILDYDPILEGDYAGYVSIAGDLIGTGTEKMTKDQLDEEIDFMGASLSTSANGVYAFGLSRYSERLMELMGDVITKPRMDATELDRIKTRTISGIVASKTDPSAISRRVLNKLMYGAKHPYGEFQTEESVKRVTLDKCKEFYTNFYRPNIGYLAIVGDMTSADAHRLVGKFLGSWQKGEVPKATYPAPASLSENAVVVVDRPAAVQSVISIGAPADLKFNDPAAIKARLMNDVLGGGSSARLFNNLREKHGYTYGAYSQLSSNKLIGSFTAGASVRTAVTDSAVGQFLYEMRRIGTEAVADSEIVLSRNGVSGTFINSLESPQTVANFAINIVRYGLPQDYYQNYLKNVAAVSKQDIQQEGARFVKPNGSYLVVVGNAQEIASKLVAYGKVKYLDQYGNPAEPNQLKPAPAGLTGALLLDKYTTAIGGKAEIAKLKDFSLTYKGEVQEQPFTLDIYRKKPNMMLSVAAVGGNEIDRSATNGKVSARQGMQGKTVQEGKDLQNALTRANFFWEADAAKAGVTANVLGVEKVNNADAIKVEFKYPSGDVWTEYFDANTFLRIRKVETRQIPNGPIALSTDYSDYTKVAGTNVLVPGTVLQPVGPMTVTLKLQESKANTGLKDSIFEIK